MQLHYQITGPAEGQPIILIHGLFGSMDNLGQLERSLQGQYQVHMLDLRNHGLSPHAAEMDYPSMAADVLEYMDSQRLKCPLILGHSMGGKVAMQLALTHPERVAGLIVADIAPVTYPNHHQQIIAGLKAINCEQLSSRKEADTILAAYEDNLGVRQFLLKNLVREDGCFQWRINLAGIAEQYEYIRQGITQQGSYSGPVLFIKGGLSSYIVADYQDEIVRRFPKVQLRIIEQAGHWLHAEKPALFARIVERFISSLS